MKSLLKWFSEQIESYEGSYKKVFSVIFLSYISGFVICDFCMILDSIYLEPTNQFGDILHTVLTMTLASAFFGGLFSLIVNVPVYFLIFRKFPALECFRIVFSTTFIFSLIGIFYRHNSGYFIVGSLVGLFLGYLFLFFKKYKFLKVTQ
jgi:hypothetical protein